jgi:alcohol dehydrogenase class IV
VNFDFATAGRIVFGRGRLAEAGMIAADLGKRALVVTGRGLGRAERVTALLRAHGIDTSLARVHGEPTTSDVRSGVSQARDFRSDVVVAVGGGSAIDLGKAVAVMLGNDGDPIDYLEVVGRGKKIDRPGAPCVAIPTTAGTGSEVTRNAVIGVPEHRVKVSLRSHFMLPAVAIVDPELTDSLPPRITASTGFDALAQVIEPYVCTRPTPVTDALCIDAIGRVARSLGRACECGADARARDDMAMASLIGGIALANAGLGAVHGFAGPIGGMFQAAHGEVCAALLPHVMAANVRALKERDPSSPVLARYDTVAESLTGRAGATADDGVAWVSNLVRTLKIPALGAHGIVAADVAEIVEKAKAASSMKANPVVLTDGELAQVVGAAIAGD